MDQYRVFGNPIKHSRSPEIHAMFAAQTGQTLEYKTHFSELDAFESDIQQFIEQGGKGANVTVPFKERALAMCESLTDRARLAGAVNTLSFINGKIHGDNTDGQGLVLDLLNNNVVLEGASILLLGAGGAAKGVVLPLLNQSPSKITVANRTVSKAIAIANSIDSKCISGAGFEDVKAEYDVIINATSASLSGGKLPIADEVIGNAKACYDMVYGETLTPFLEKAKALSVDKYIDGLGMLVGQAAEAFSIWRGVMPEIDPVLKHMSK